MGRLSTPFVVIHMEMPVCSSSSELDSGSRLNDLWRRAKGIRFSRMDFNRMRMSVVDVFSMENNWQMMPRAPKFAIMIKARVTVGPGVRCIQNRITNVCDNLAAAAAAPEYCRPTCLGGPNNQMEPFKDSTESAGPLASIHSRIT